MGRHFLGEFALRIDEKGRLVIPAKWREGMADGLVVTPGADDALWLFPQDQFASWVADPRFSDITSPEARRASEALFALAHDQVPDKQGRCAIPARLRARAGIDRDCYAAGMGSYIALFDAGIWEARQSTLPTVSEVLAAASASAGRS